ncbi:MAG TPA: hypothetical protein DHV48_03895 [Prolixibacteraceae bacterium]|nr:hypothetical protein [Prolixibacteraceae bacterium]
MQEKIEIKSIIRCPACGFEKQGVMHEDSCQFFYECENCKNILKTLRCDCCVFCSYGSVPCPPVQAKSSSGQ